MWQWAVAVAALEGDGNTPSGPNRDTRVIYWKHKNINFSTRLTHKSTQHDVHNYVWKIFG